MSSDTYRVKVKKVEGREVTLEIVPTTAAGLGDLAFTRSFVAMLLYDVGGPSLFYELQNDDWNKAHLDEYVVNTRLVSLIGLRDDALIRRFSEQFVIPIRWLQPHLTLVAEMATEELAGHFQSALSFGTTAYDVWYYDPKRPALPSDWVYPPTFDPDPALLQRIVPLVRALLPQWSPEGDRSLYLSSADGLRLTVSFDQSTFGTPFRGHFNIRALLWLEALRNRYVKANPNGSSVLAQAGIPPSPPAVVWCKTCDLYASDPETTPRESDEELAERIAAELQHESIQPWLNANSAASIVEDICEGLVKRFKVKTFQRLRPTAAPHKWSWNASNSDIFWIRVALYGELGDDASAKEAAQQACARWKKPPKWITGELARLGV